ncbi:MAG: hypothetical protein JSR37_03920 [Verrucomicrobia bacterium]|nr:hypothetical protein [Verrucomicrobiota bacterium]
MIKAITLAAVAAGCFLPLHAQEYNLKAHEKRINAYHDKMKQDGKELSKEFLKVHQGMKKGAYTYDLETARKVMREVHANRMPKTPELPN